MNAQHMDCETYTKDHQGEGRSEKGGGRGGGRVKGGCRERESRVCLVVYVEPRLFN